MTNTEAVLIPSIFPGDLVQIRPISAGPHRGVTFLVVEVPGYGSRRTKTKIRTTDGQFLTGSPDLFIPAGHPDWIGPVPTAEAFREAVAETDLSAGLVVGSLIELKKTPGLYVVTGETNGKFRAALLGGDGNRYRRSIIGASIKAVHAPGSFSVTLGS